MTADKYNSERFKHLGTACNHIFLYTAGVCDDRAGLELVLVLFYEFNDSFGIKAEHSHISVIKSVRCYYLVYCAAVESLSAYLAVSVKSHYMMKCIFLQCLADRAAYQTKTYYCYFHFCPSFSRLKRI